MLVLVRVKVEVVEEVDVSDVSLGQRERALVVKSAVDARMSDDDVRFYMGAQCRALHGHERDTWLIWYSNTDQMRLFLTLLEPVRSCEEYIAYTFMNPDWILVAFWLLRGHVV